MSAAALHQSAAAIGPIAAAIIKALEQALLGLVGDPTAKLILQKIIDYVNSLLGIGDPVQALAELHSEAAKGGPFIQALVQIIEKAIASLASNPAVLQAIIDFIKGLLVTA